MEAIHNFTTSGEITRTICIVVCLVSFSLGVLIGYLLKTILKKGVRIVIKKLDNVVLFLSFFGAAGCIYLNLYYKENNVSIQILGFYTSFIFSWLLTKKSSKAEYTETQHKIAKSTHRHIEDVETAVLITQDRLGELRNKAQVTPDDIDGILDNIDIIITGIRSNKEDWQDLLKQSYVKRKKREEDPEAKLEHVRERTNGKRNRGGQVKQPPEISGLNNAIEVNRKMTELKPTNEKSKSKSKSKSSS